MGEQSELVLTRKRVSAAKMLAQGVAFEFSGLREALQQFCPRRSPRYRNQPST